jgi:hypothetical protein
MRQHPWVVISRDGAGVMVDRQVFEPVEGYPAPMDRAYAYTRSQFGAGYDVRVFCQTYPQSGETFYQGGQ